MLKPLYALPLIVILMGIGASAMLVPASYAYAVDDMRSARVFLYGGVLFLVLTTLIGIATINNPRGTVLRSHLLALIGAYTILPVMLAVPVIEVVQDTRFINAYFEMLSSLTTTGATVFDPASRLPDAVHLWRAIVGWMGGFFVWLSAMAILGPLNLGGFEVTARGNIGSGQFGQASDPAARLRRHAADLFPVYSGLTAALWLFLVIIGEDGFVGLCHAMSTLATSGITPLESFSEATGGRTAEALVFIFLFFALSRLTFAPETQSDSLFRLMRDPEFRLGIGIVLFVSLALFARHWIAATEIGGASESSLSLQALWGAMFTVMSYLTTTGFEASDWTDAQRWSGLETPGLALVGLAIVGGGVATTAGGAKLLRVYALYKHGMREMDRLAYPASVGGRGEEARHLRNHGAHMAWIFFMLFAISVVVIMGAFALTGVGFDLSIILTVASLSTTGPLANIASDPSFSYALLADGSKLVLCAAMVVGRLETLAIIALMSPEFWRN